MARRRIVTPPTSAEDPKRRAFAIAAIRTIGLRLHARRELDEPTAWAWRSAWIAFEQDRGPCPISPAELASVTASWPRLDFRRTAALIDAWSP